MAYSCDVCDRPALTHDQVARVTLQTWAPNQMTLYDVEHVCSACRTELRLVVQRAATTRAVESV